MISKGEIDMTKAGRILADILRYALIPFVAIIAVFAFRLSFHGIHNLFTGYGVWMFIAGVIALVLGIFTINSKFDKKDKLWIIMGIALVLRILWIKFVPSVPVSDYATMYDCAGKILEGDFSGMQGIGYFARYPHLVLSVLYMAFMRFMFGEGAIMSMKYVSVLLSLINIFLIYKISVFFTKKEKGTLLCALFASIFPPFITYVSTFCTENYALPFLFAAILYFCKIVNGEFSVKNAVLCGVFLGISNMFRGVGAIILVAMIIFIFLRTFKNRIKTISIITASMLAIIALVSTIILFSGVTEAHIWQGKESSITYFLKGLNVDAKGAWNQEDAIFVEEHFMDENFDEQCMNVIKARLNQKSPSELARFFFDKFVNQWVYGDCNGAYWAFMNTPINYRYPADAFSQIFSSILILLTLISLFKRQNKYETLLHIFMCGFGIFFLIFESQPRYAYIIYWIFVPLAVQGAENVYSIWNKWRNK